MKNLFKSLMLVAVAAMAFTACQKDNAEVNQAEQTRVVKFTATIGEDDTRSGFTEKVGNAYKSAWDGNEMLIVYGESTREWPTINEQGQFEVEFDEGDQFATILSPAAAWNGSGTSYTVDIPATQTPRTSSVDPAAHILRAQNVPIDSDNISFSMQHEVAYGKMTVDDTPAEFEIAKVVINLVGDYYGDKNLTYTLNATNVENNTFWFATEPINVSEFTVKAYDSNGNIMAKTVSDIAENGLKFDYGRVSTFAVSGLTEQEAPAAPVFTTATWTNNSTSDKFVQFYSDVLGTLQLNFYNSNEDNNGNWIDAREYTFANNGEIYPGGTYSWYQPVGGSTYYATTGTVIVAIVEGLYHIQFIGIKDSYNPDNYELNATFTGEISGLTIPNTDPVMTLSTKELIFTCASASRNVSVTTKNTTEAIEATSNNAQFTTIVDGNIVTITAHENTSTEEITGTITITCGELSDTISVTQRGFVDGGGVQDGTKDNPYLYTCVVTPKSGYYTFTFTSETEGAKPLYLESLTDIIGDFKTGAIIEANNWYTPSWETPPHKYADGTITTAWDESTITITKLSDNELSFDEIMLSTFNGYVYYRCESVVFL